MSETFAPRTELVRQLLEIRARILEAGYPPLTLAEINGEPEPARTCATCKWVEAVGNAATCQNKRSFVALTSLAFGCILHKPREAQP